MRFFFYGTLIAGSGNRVAGEAHARLRDLGAATVAGALHAVGDPLGWYPVLLPGAGTVHGRLYATEPGFDAADLARLDAWEDCDPGDPAASLYRREAIAVTDADGARCEAQCYRYNRALPAGARPIGDGDFRPWLRRVGLRAYGAGS
jgi:gamma-glutamylcyclotransferase (GGCT)/AIG2-like uncharacterized protein YtfP